MKKAGIILSLIVLLGLIGFFSPYGVRAQKNLPAFRMGMIPDLSGGAADAGIAQKSGLLLAVDEYNKMSNRKLNARAIVYDDQSKPDKAVPLLIRQIEHDKISAHLSTTASGSGAAIMEYLQKNKIELFL